MNKIKEFFARYSYDAVKMVLDQVAMILFGMSIGLAATLSSSRAIVWIGAVGSAVFYWFLLYMVAWKMGDMDRTSIDLGKKKFNPLTGLYVSLLANSVNLIIALAATVSQIAIGGVGVPGVVGLLANDMYFGLMYNIKIGGVTLNQHWWAFYVMIIPALLVSMGAYAMGAKGKVLGKIMVPDLPASDRPTRKEKKERAQAEKKKDQGGNERF